MIKSPQYKIAEKKFIKFLESLEGKFWDKIKLPKEIPGADVLLKDLGGNPKLGNIRFGVVTQFDGKYWTRDSIFYGTAKEYLEARYKAHKCFVELCWYRRTQHGK